MHCNEMKRLAVTAMSVISVTNLIHEGIVCVDGVKETDVLYVDINVHVKIVKMMAHIQSAYLQQVRYLQALTSIHVLRSQKLR